MDQIILASGSPRRQDILRQMGIRFTVSPQDVDETFEGLSAGAEAMRLAEKKVRACIAAFETESGAGSADHAWILGADTFIEFEGGFLGKAADRDSAREMLQRLSGRTHEVLTGIALNVPGKGVESTCCITEVRFSELADDEIEWYLDTEEWRGVAAAYRIQEKASVFIESITGSWSNVMGLPINTFYGMLRANKFNFRS